MRLIENLFFHQVGNLPLHMYWNHQEIMGNFSPNVVLLVQFLSFLMQKLLERDLSLLSQPKINTFFQHLQNNDKEVKMSN